MKTLTGFMTAVGIGASAMYFLDPDRGVQRRARAQEKMTQLGKVAAHQLEHRTRGLSRGWYGVQAGWRAFWQDLPVTDDALAKRVRAGMGHLSRDLSSLQILAEKGRVILSGAVNRDEVDQIIRAASAVPGVHSVVNHLELRH